MNQHSLEVDLQLALDEKEEPPASEAVPSLEEFSQWADCAWKQTELYLECAPNQGAEMSLRVVGSSEMTTLNSQYRGKPKPTNVLSFPFDSEFDFSDELELRLLGDVVICHDVVVDEARQQNKSLGAHYAHMVTHGVLHLCGYDHETDTQAHEMESLEIKALQGQGLANPYIEVKLDEQ